MLECMPACVRARIQGVAWILWATGATKAGADASMCCATPTQCVCCRGYAWDPAKMRCAECQAGFYCPGGMSGVACPPGTFNAGYGATNSTACRAWRGTQCGANQFIQGAPSPTQDLSCGACKSACAPGFFRQTLCTGREAADSTTCSACRSCQARTYQAPWCDGGQAVDSSCVACSDGGCGPGKWREACSAGADGACRDCSACPSGFYNQGCGGNSNGTCTRCTSCGAGMSQGSACGKLEDATCVGASCNATKGCGTLFCSYTVIDTPGCAVVWKDDPLGSPGFLCKTSPTQGTCQRCPPGWTTSGAHCVECELGRSCNAEGRPMCEGQCAAGASPTCDASTGFVACSVCPTNRTALALQKRILTRGGVLDAPELCESYFQCETGYYLTSTGNGTRLSCERCVFPEPAGGAWMARSHGLTFGDAFSCMYAPMETLRGSNDLGKYGALQTSCPEGGFTSRAAAAANASGCMACPNAPAGGRFKAARFDCTVECEAPFERRGEACVHLDRRLIMCDQAGYSSGPDGCEPQPLPWNDAGFVVTGGPAWTVTRTDPRSPEVTGMDASGGVVATDTLFLSGSALCDSIVASVANPGYVQDKPLFAATCGDTESHRFYLVCRGERYVYAFLERTFGANNRFVMWQVDTSQQPGRYGRVPQVWRLPGKVCSAAWSVLGGVEYVYAAFCGTAFIMYTRVVDLTANPSGAGNTQAIKPGTQYEIGRRYGILIGETAPGLSDGLRDVA